MLGRPIPRGPGSGSAAQRDDPSPKSLEPAPSLLLRKNISKESTCEARRALGDPRELLPISVRETDVLLETGGSKILEVGFETKAQPL